MRSAVRICPDPPIVVVCDPRGAIAQLGERLLCTQEVSGSIPLGSTTYNDVEHGVLDVGVIARKLRNEHSLRDRS